jgi:hypothetical protein
VKLDLFFTEIFTEIIKVPDPERFWGRLIILKGTAVWRSAVRLFDKSIPKMNLDNDIRSCIRRTLVSSSV